MLPNSDTQEVRALGILLVCSSCSSLLMSDPFVSGSCFDVVDLLVAYKLVCIECEV